MNARNYKMKYTTIIGVLFTSIFAFGMAPFNESVCCSSICFAPLLVTCIQPGEEGGFEHPHGPDKKQPTKLTTQASTGKSNTRFGMERKMPPNMIEHAMAVAKEIDPDLAAQLSLMCETDPEAFQNIIMRQGRRLGSLIRLREKDPELFEVKVTELKTDAEIYKITEELRGQDFSATQSQAKMATLQGLVRARTAISLHAQTLHIGRLEKHLEALRQKLETTITEFDEIVEERVEKLLTSISETKKTESPQTE